MTMNAFQNHKVNAKQVFHILMQRQRENVIALGRHGRIPDVNWTDVMDRLTPRARNNWDIVRDNFRQLRCRIRAEYLGSNAHPNNPLLVLAVYPMQILPVRGQGDPDIPWHISLSFYDPERKPEFTAVEQKYGQSRIVTLEGWIQGSTFQLDPMLCPIASDPVVRNLHAADPYYGDAPLHVSF